MKLDVSICTFNNDKFDIIFIDRSTGRELTFSGTQKLSEEEFNFADKIAPACVYTEYLRVTPED